MSHLCGPQKPSYGACSCPSPLGLACASTLWIWWTAPQIMMQTVILSYILCTITICILGFQFYGGAPLGEAPKVGGSGNGWCTERAGIAQALSRTRAPDRFRWSNLSIKSPGIQPQFMIRLTCTPAGCCRALACRKWWCGLAPSRMHSRERGYGCVGFQQRQTPW